MRVAHRNQHNVSLDLAFGAFDRRDFASGSPFDLYGLHGLHGILAFKAHRIGGKKPRAPFFLRSRSPLDMAPVRPLTHQIGLERQFGVIVELRHGGSPQSVSRADAVACRLAAADHHNMLAADLNRIDAAPGIHPILCNQEVKREVNPGELAPGELQIARHFSAQSQHDGVVLGLKGRNGNGRFRIIMNPRLKRFSVGPRDAGGEHETHPLAHKLIESAVNHLLAELEVRNAVAQKTARLIHLFVNGNRMPHPSKLLCRGQACWARGHHSHGAAR